MPVRRDPSADYPVRTGDGDIIEAWPYDPAWVRPTRPNPRDPGPDYPVRNGNGTVIVATPYEGYNPATPIFIAMNEAFAASARSFLAFPLTQTPDGGTNFLQTRWQVPYYVNYLGFSTLQQRWDANSVDRTATYSGALWLTEFTGPGQDWPGWNTDANRATLRYLYRYGLMAQAKGCKAVYIYPPWSPEALTALDPSTMARAESWRVWLQKYLTIPVLIMPVPQIVAAWRSQYSPQSIYSDGLHMRSPSDPAPNQFYLGMALAIEYMMTRRAPNMTGVSAEVQALFASAKPIIDGIQSAGLGGSTVIAPDNTSDPLPYPESTVLLTDAHTLSANMVENNLSPSAVDLSSNGKGGDKRTVYSPPPVGSRIQFTVSVISGNWWWRHGNVTLGMPANIWSSSVPVSDVVIDYIVTQDQFDRGYMGAISNGAVAELQIRNFRVTAPA